MISCFARKSAVSVETIENFNENTLLILAAEAKPEELTRSMKEMIDHFKEELLKKDKKLTPWRLS
jgi:hypothetical protein